MRRLISFPAGLLLVYCVLAFGSFWTTWRSPTARWIGNSVDPNLFIWCLGWIAHAVTHGHDPLVTDYLRYPDGVNLMWNTSVIFPALVLTPVTLLFGAVLSYNVLATLALALSAWCAYFALRRYTGDVGAAVGGLLYGFGPYTFAQARDHPQMTFALFPPLVLLLLDEILVRQRRSAIGIGCLLGLATALQVLTGQELAAATALLAAIGAVLLALLEWKAVRASLPHAARALMAAAVVASAILAYPLMVQFFGMNRYAGKGAVQLPDTFVSDLLAFLVPTHHQELTFAAAGRLEGTFTGPSEFDAYIGVPLLALAIFVVVRYRTEPVVRFAAGLGVIAAILSLGPRLHVAGESLPIRLPWVVPQRLPLLEHILPARLAVFTLLMLSLLVAVFIDRARLPRAAVAAIVAVAFLPLFPNFPYPHQPAASPPFFERGAREIPLGSAAMIEPPAGLAAATARPMLWQVAAKFRFRMPGGYIIGGARHTAALDDRTGLLEQRIKTILHGDTPAPLDEGRRRALRCDLVRLRARTVVVAPMKVGRPQILRLFRALLDRPPVEVGGVQLWRDVLETARRHAGDCT